MNSYTFRLTGLLFLVLSLAACGDDGGASETADPDSLRPAFCLGKCDGTPSTGYVSEYEVVIAKANEIWPGSPAIETIDDAYMVLMKLGEVEFKSPTHLFGIPVNVIPYSDDDDVKDADDYFVKRGDSVIAKAFPPGQIGYAVKHHRPEHRTLEASALESNGKEHFKLQDTHIELVVGVMRDGAAGAITLNNPQNYQDGYFGDKVYSMIFLRIDYPDYLDLMQAQQFNDNIRTMMAGFNTVSNFPGDYNGGDPLAAHTVERVKEHTAMMVRAIADDEEAKAFFDDPLHQIYCAELAHVATSAGLIVPLNAATMVPVVGQEAWDKFVAEVNKHNIARAAVEQDGELYEKLASGDEAALTEAGIEISAFVAGNDNKRVALVELTLADEGMLPAAQYAPADKQAAEAAKIAFKPMTMADIVEQFLRTHVPREQLGESMAPVQGMLLQKMKPGLLEAMGMDQIPEEDPRKVAVNGLFDQLVQVVSNSYGSYDEFRAALEPLMAQARVMTGPRDDTGTGYFVPPSLLHVIAQGKHLGGLVGLKYEGHGVHFSACKKKGGAVQPQPEPEPEPEPEPDPTEPEEEVFENSCRMACGGSSPGDSCYCDGVCLEYGDCCEDYQEHCAAAAAQ